MFELIEAIGNLFLTFFPVGGTGPRVRPEPRTTEELAPLTALDIFKTLLFLAVLLGIFYGIYRFFTYIFGVPPNPYDVQADAAFVVKSDNSTARRPVSEELAMLAAADKNDPSFMPEAQQSLVNFFALGTRFTGYLGPMENGFYKPDEAVQLAVQGGSRVFVLEIDYINECRGPNAKYFPRIVVRDVHGRLMINEDTSKPLCNTSAESTIQYLCERINFYAFAPSAQNATDPVIIVLYFLRQPPGSYKSKTVLDYYSNVAKALAPLRDRMVHNELDGGTFYRQKQEGRLLTNRITDYNGKVLVFSNANTNGFREVSYPPNEDLDFLVNLRLHYTQTKLGVTENDSAAVFGILQTAEDYMQIPSDRAEETAENTKMRWTLCLAKDPSKPVTKEVYDKITRTYGVHCVPAVIFDKTSSFMFGEGYFQKYSFLPKPADLRHTTTVVIPAKPSELLNANQGKLRMPTVM